MRNSVRFFSVVTLQSYKNPSPAAAETSLFSIRKFKRNYKPTHHKSNFAAQLCSKYGLAADKNAR